MDELVMAMPCREFIAIRGFSAKIDLAILDSIQDDTWFTIPAAVQADPLAVIVHVGLLVLCGDQVLISNDGRIVQHATVPPEALSSKSGLAALKALTEQRCQEMLRTRGRVELAGLIHEPKLLPRQVLLVYRCVIPPGTPVAMGTWQPVAEICDDPNRDWVDQAVLPAIPRAKPT